MSLAARIDPAYAGGIYHPTLGNDPAAQGPSTLSTNDTQAFNKELFERFGMPQNGNPLVNPSGAVRTVYETYPEAFGGPYRDGRTSRNRHIETILIKQIADSERFIPNNVFPIILNMDGGTKYSVTQLKFHNHELDRIPELGVPRLLTKSSNTWEVNIPRFGLGFFMEHGFAMTPIGRRQYDMSILQIRNAVWETIDRDAYSQLLSCSRTASQIEHFWQHFNSPFGAGARINQIIDYECQYWGALNRKEHAITALIDHAERMMARHDLKPEICMGPKGFMQCIGRRPELAEFMRIGPRAIDAQKSPEGNLSVYEARGIKFHEVPLVSNFVDDEWEQPEDPLERTRTIGTFFQMAHPCRDMGAQYKSYYSDIVVHNNDTDQMETLRRADVEEHCAFDGDILAALVRTAFGFERSADVRAVTWKEYFLRLNARDTLWEGALTNENGKADGTILEKAIFALGDLRGASVVEADPSEVREMLKRMHNANLMAPFNYLIMRPWEQWNMGSLIFTLGNGKAGFTHIGQQDFQLGHNPISKYLEGSFTLNLGVVIENRDAVFVFHNVKYGDYKSGGGNLFFKPQEAERLAEMLLSRESEFPPSLIVAPYHVHERIQRSHIDITGFFTSNEWRNAQANGGSSMHYSTAPEVAKFWHIYPTPESYMFDTTYHAHEGSRGLGSRLSQGHQLMYSNGGVHGDKPRPASVQLIGRGHHGPITYPGVCADRQGKGGRAYVAINTIYDQTPLLMVR